MSRSVIAPKAPPESIVGHRRVKVGGGCAFFRRPDAGL